MSDRSIDRSIDLVGTSTRLQSPTQLAGEPRKGIEGRFMPPNLDAVTHLTRRHPRDMKTHPLGLHRAEVNYTSSTIKFSSFLKAGQSDDRNEIFCNASKYIKISVIK